MLHEFFHVLQYQNGWSFGQVWLYEGSAEYVGFRGALIDKGLLTGSQVRNCHVWNVFFSTPQLGRLQDYEESSRNWPNLQPVSTWLSNGRLGAEAWRY